MATMNNQIAYSEVDIISDSILDVISLYLTCNIPGHRKFTDTICDTFVLINNKTQSQEKICLQNNLITNISIYYISLSQVEYTFYGQTL